MMRATSSNGSFLAPWPGEGAGFLRILRTLRASIIPIVTIPVSLVGAFALMALAVIIRFKSYVTGKFDDTGAN